METTTEVVEVAGKPKVIKETHTVGKVKIDFAVDLLLKFIVQNPQGPISVWVGGTSISAAAGQNSVTVDVGDMMSLSQPDGKLSVI